MHLFKRPYKGIDLPDRFTCPFCYTPHPLTLLAAEECVEYIESREDWREELSHGKMFGLMVVESQSGELGFITAFSALLGGTNRDEWFVPPIFDMLEPNGYFKQEERAISEINIQISRAMAGETVLELEGKLCRRESEGRQEVEQLRLIFKEAKESRERRRREGRLSPEQLDELSRESQFQKAELKRLERSVKVEVEACRAAVMPYREEIARLKQERKERSAKLQQWLFDQYVVRNGDGEESTLAAIFSGTAQKVAPAGAGECTAPKLLNYAYLNNLRPITMGEFWWGDSPKGEIRHHREYYAACKGKCEPILNFMLQGLDVEPNPLEKSKEREPIVDICYEDEWLLVVNKESGVLSVPGKGVDNSLLTVLRKRYEGQCEIFATHRLDMATSGLLLFAKREDVYKELQRQFSAREIHKRYIAILEGHLECDKGVVDLPLIADYLDRPRQKVNFESGKPSITEYEALGEFKEKGRVFTKVALYPHTGRTHQLRLHAAHPLGLNAPIVGDELYGRSSERLMLHAEYIKFRHPVSGEKIEVSCEFNCKFC